MSSEIIKNTLVFQFPDGAPGPTVVEIGRFVKGFDADKADMEAGYKISDERVVCIKFKSERAMKEALLHNPEVHTFHYSNGKSVEVRMSVAGGCIRYVRIFDLPPEISDVDVSLVLGRYGNVKRMIREKFPAELELELITGVRGVYMDIKKEIPAALHFSNRRGRIYYEGLRQKCFLCKQEGHLKAKCPQNNAHLGSRNEDYVENPESKQDAENVKNTVAEASRKEELSQSGKDTYAGAVQGVASSSKTSNKMELSMVKLVSLKTVTPAAVSNPEDYQESESDMVEVLEEEEVNIVDPSVNSGQAPDQESSDEERMVEQERSNKRPLASSSKSESEEHVENFVTVDRSRKSRKQKRNDELATGQNPLEVLAAVSSCGSRSRSSKSQRNAANRSRSRSGVKQGKKA